MAIAFDAASEAGTPAYATSLSWSHTCTGDNRILIVGLSFFLTVTDVAVTYNGVAMTLVDNAVGGNGGKPWMFRLVAPATGSNTIAASWTTSSSCAGGGMSFTGVSQSAPLGTAAKNTGASTTPTVDVTSASGELVVDVVSNANAGGAPSVGADQTERYNQLGSGTNNVYGAGSHEAGAATTTMSWTIVSTNWGIVAVPLKPSLDFVPRVAFIA